MTNFTTLDTFSQQANLTSSTASTTIQTTNQLNTHRNKNTYLLVPIICVLAIILTVTIPIFYTEKKKRDAKRKPPPEHYATLQMLSINGSVRSEYEDLQWPLQRSESQDSMMHNYEEPFDAINSQPRLFDTTNGQCQVLDVAEQNYEVVFIHGYYKMTPFSYCSQRN